jgi:hypothetical protein
MIPEFDFSAEITEAKKALAAAAEALPALRTARQAAIDAELDAQQRYNAFVLRFNTAVRARSGSADPATAPLLALLEEQRQLLHTVRCTLTRARREVATAEWRAAAAREALDQLQRAENPPPIEHRPEVVKRQPPDLGPEHDVIVFPGGKAA